ncbi:unnamed protein product [Alternaria alternata]
MPDPAQINRSLGTIKTELEYLANSGVLSPPQLQSIQAQLPQPNGQPSQYIDPKYVNGGNQFNPAMIAQQAQDPAHPANPNHPKSGKVEQEKNTKSKEANLIFSTTNGLQN